jgi:V8-like Glu-specific endopeptidase
MAFRAVPLFGLLAAALISLALATPAHAAPTPAVAGIALPDAREHVRDVAEFWTKRRMREARPIGLERPSSAPTGDALSASAPRPGAPILVPGRPPAEPAEPAESAGLARAPRSHIPFDQHVVPDTTTYPNSTNGKVFVRLGHGFGLASCSATVVESDSGSVVLTAGHCVHDGGRHGDWLDRKWTFVPGYDHGTRPFGTFAATELWTTRGWRRRANGNFDLGAAILAANAAGRTVAEAAGTRGFAANLPRAHLFHALGYPGAPPFDGETLHECVSQYAGDDRKSRFYSGPLPLRIGCDMTGGSSGGGWVIDDRYVNSVTTHGYFGHRERDRLYGPYFGTRAAQLYEAVRR